MSKLSFVFAASMLTLPLLGCTEPGNSQTGPLTVSKNVKLTATGMRTPAVSVTPVKLTFPDSRSYSAVPYSFQPESCSLISSHFTAEVPIPSQVNLPAYGPNTPPLRVLCDSENFTFDKSFKRVNLTQQAIATASVAHVLIGYGLIGAAVTASAGSQRDTSQDTYGYPLKIELQ